MRKRKKGILSNYLRNKRNNIIIPYLKGTVFDFGSKDEVLKSSIPEGDYFSIPDTKPGDEYTLEGEYDTFLLIAVLEHVDDISSLLKKIDPLIKKRLVITTPSPFAKRVLNLGSAIGLFHSHNKEEHVKYYSKEDLYRLLKSNGFKIVEYKRFEFGLNQIIIGERL